MVVTGGYRTLTQSTRLPVLGLLFFLATLLPHATHAAIRMEVGNQGMQLDRQGLSVSETEEHSLNDVIIQTPPRPDTNTTAPEELPFGIVPEVLVPWHPPGPQPPASGIRPKPPKGAE